MDHDDDDWWQGDLIIPQAPQNDAIDELKRAMRSMISDNITSEVQGLQESLHALSERVQLVETELKQSQTPSSSGSEFDSPVTRRKRRIPLELQASVSILLCACVIFFSMKVYAILQWIHT